MTIQQVLDCYDKKKVINKDEAKRIENNKSHKRNKLKKLFEKKVKK